MATTENAAPKPRKPLRLWPGIALAALMLFLRFVLPVFTDEATQIGVLAGIAGGALILLWWLFLSRAPWAERLGVLALLVAAIYVTRLLVHESISQGAMGMLFFILAIPTATLALVAGAFAARGKPAAVRRSVLAASVLVGCGLWLLVRTGGFSGNFDNDLHWRWTPTPEERLLAQAEAEPLAPSPPPAAAAPAPAPAGSSAQGGEPAAAAEGAAPAAAVPPPSEPAAAASMPAVAAAAAPEAPAAAAASPAAWPGFRGPRRDSAVPAAVRIATDWAASPPVEMWRRPIGPGWSSFAVDGDRLYTQEQRGDAEVVACYDLATGAPVWRHEDAARFWESNAGAGPRGTPTLHDGRVYSLGATGILNALDARDGSVVWSRNAAGDTKSEVPGWGFSSSPEVVGDLVIVATAGKLAAYDVESGEPRWFGPDGDDGYSSPHRATLAGVQQIVFLSARGAVGVAPGDGKVLWEHPWKAGPRIVQPTLLAGGDLLIPGGEGLRRVALERGAAGWTVEERWTTNGLKPYFNDLVVHDGHAYGFDGRILAAIDLQTGKRTWKGGRYGNGQLVLLPEQDLLLVLAEEGDIALVAAKPDAYAELARVPAIKGKTWNHPVLVGDVLLVRNGEEMAAFRLASAGG